MSSVIDERVVQMSFDNDQFEKGVSQTINSLNKLDKTLVDTADGEYFTKMEERISRVEQAFTKSGMVINGVLIGIGQTINQYINKGLAALTSGIRGGMQEYETQMGATQTILANVKDEGKGINDVTAALDELNTYADKTIYNFTEMTRNIGMFTAAGANLDTSVATIKGLANAAALVGANATTAARAWYQVSQAMAAGSFKLMDWRSLEISNIAGEGFKSVLTEVARKDGLAVAKMIDNGTALRDTLKSGWLTAERFAEAMQILTNELSEDQLVTLGYTEEQAKKLKEIATEAEYAAIKVKSFSQLMETTAEAIGSGWAVTFRTIIGDFERARDFYTRISVVLGNIIDKISDYRNHFLELVWNWAQSGGASPYKNFKDSLDNILAIFSTFVGAMRAGFDNIFKWDEINKNLNNFADGIRRTTRALVLNEDKDTTNYWENEEKKIKDAAHEYEQLDDFEKSNIWDLDYVTEGIKDLIRVFRGAFAAVDIVLRTVGDTFSWLINQIPGIDNFYENLENGNLGILSTLANIMDKVTMVRDMIVDLDLIPNILNLIKQSIINIIKTNPLLMSIIGAVDYAIRVVKAFIATLKDLNISPFNVLLGALKLIAGAIGAIIYGISEAINKVIQFISGNVNFSFLDSIGQEIMTLILLLSELGKGTISVTDIFEYYKQRVIKAFESIMRSPFVEGFVKFFTNAWNVIKTFWNNIVNFFTNLGDNISNFYETYFGDLDFDIKDFGLFGVLAAIGILLYKFTRDVEGWASIGSRIADVLNAFANKVNSESLLNIAKAVGILAASILVLSLIPYQTLLDTVSMVSVVMVMFMGLFTVIKKTFDALEAVKKSIEPIEKMGLNLSKGIQRFVQRAGTALVLEALGDALIKIAIAIIGLGLAFQFMPDAMENAIKTIAGVAAVLILLSVAIALLINSSPLKGIKGLTKIGDAINLGLSSLFDGLGQFLKIVAIAIIVEAFADAVIKLAAALAIIAYVAENSTNYGAAIGSLVGIMVAVAAAIAGFYFLTSKVASVSAPDFLAISVVIFAFAGAVAALAVVSAALANVDIWDLVKGVGAVVVLLHTIAGAVLVMSMFIKADTAGTFMAFSAMMLALGAGFAAITYAASLIGSGEQLGALGIAIGGMISIMGLMALMAAILKVSAVDFGVILSFSAIVGAMALAFVAMGYAFSQLKDVHIDDNILIALGAMMGAIVLVTGIIGILSTVIGAMGPEISVFVDVAIVGFAAAIAAWGYVAWALGQLALNIAQSQLIFQEAMVGWYDILVFLATRGELFVSTLEGAAGTLLNAIPNLFTLFVSVGVAIGTALDGITLGLRTVIAGVVLNMCSMILEILIMIADWVNNNSSLILTALIKVFTAILNLAVVALGFTLGAVLPIVLKVIIDFITTLIVNIMAIFLNLIKSIYELIGNALVNSGNPVLEAIGNHLLYCAEGIGTFVDSLKEAEEIIHEWTSNITGWLTEAAEAIGFVKDSTEELKSANLDASEKIQNGMLAISNSAMSTAKDVIEACDGQTESYDRLNANIEANTEKIHSNNEKMAAGKKAEADAFNFYNQTEADSTADAISSMISMTDEGLKINTDAIKDSFSLTLDNQGSMIDSYLGNVDYLGKSSNGKTKNYLDTNADLYNDYFNRLSSAEQDWYEIMEEAGKKANSGDHAGAAALYADANELMKNSDFTWQDILNDNVDFDTKGIFESVKPSKAVFDSWEGLGNAISDYMANYKSAEVDTSAFSPDFGSSGTDTSKLQDELKQRNDMIGKADSEIQPKDLTPTIDLDKLKGEVNQANGIMTGSLLAAQNAAIGDYINTDSELNPFLKDRWQNTYNFTQNNYSPKALSRIDIYRQTQNQLRLSRGM